MAVFSAPAWMMKGGGSSGATIETGMFDEDPYKQGKTKVGLTLSNVNLNISNNNSKYILKFDVSSSGFTQNAKSVEFRLELRVAGHWRYTTVINNVDLSTAGTTKTINISDQINKSGEVKQLLTDPKKGNVKSDGNGNCYLLFETNTEISNDQIKCQIKKT